MFDYWPQRADGTDLLPPSAATDGFVLAIDGPQGLAATGRRMRASEQRLGTPGKTPDVLPVPCTKPFAGYVRGSVELFSMLLTDPRFILAGMESAGRIANLIEVYPGKAWPALAGTGTRLPAKKRPEGIQARERLPNSLGVTLPDGGRLTHDDLDAALVAFIAYRFVRGRPRFVGEPPFVQEGTLREGWIVQPER